MDTVKEFALASVRAPGPGLDALGQVEHYDGSCFVVFFAIAADCRYFEDHQAIFGGRVSALEHAGDQNSCIFLRFLFSFCLTTLVVRV